MPLTLSHAKERRLVLIPDGRIGRLMFIQKDSRRVKVYVDGRHLLFKDTELRLVNTHLAGPADDRTLCCGAKVADLSGADCTVENPSEVSCRGR
jgi:hypothetical protein